MVETILQHWIVTQFILPFALVTAIVFGVLEKTKLLGEENKQLNAIIAFVVGLIFVGAIWPKIFVDNMILFLTVGLVVLFIILLLWGFVSGGGKEGKGFELEGWMKYILWIVGGIAVIIAVFWASGSTSNVFDLLFKQTWSESFWTNFAFILVIGIALALVMKKAKGST
ncbi:MAG: hypothetical protein ABIA78_00325 [archaeon]